MYPLYMAVSLYSSQTDWQRDRVPIHVRYLPLDILTSGHGHSRIKHQPRLTMTRCQLPSAGPARRDCGDQVDQIGQTLTAVDRMPDCFPTQSDDSCCETNQGRCDKPNSAVEPRSLLFVVFTVCFVMLSALCLFCGFGQLSRWLYPRRDRACCLIRCSLFPLFTDQSLLHLLD